MVDFFGKVPDIVIDNIIERLPIRSAAQTSVLSKQWRRAWLSLKILSFDRDFWLSDWVKCCQIISNILLYHDGLVYKFYIDMPFDIIDHCMSYSHSQWISFLSKNGVREIFLGNLSFSGMDITSYIFRCSEIVDLTILGCNLNPPPTEFSGFPNLRNLKLNFVNFNKPNIFCGLIENCKMLQTLELNLCVGMDRVVIDLPCLHTFILFGNLESLAFKNVRGLKRISLTLSNSFETLTTDALSHLASSCQLQYISFDRHLCKFFANIKRSSSVAFNYLDELCLISPSLSDFDVLRDVLSMIECCPYITKLDITVCSGENVSQDVSCFNYNYKLDHLRKVNFEGMTGSSAELKLVEYLLAISPVLENMFFQSYRHSMESKLKMLSALMGFPRASTNARLLFIEK